MWNWLKAHEGEEVGNGLDLIARAIRMEDPSKEEWAGTTAFVQDGLRRIMQHVDQVNRRRAYHDWAAAARHPKTNVRLEQEILEGTWQAGQNLSKNAASERYPFTKSLSAKQPPSESSKASPQTSSTTPGSDTD